MCDQNVLFEILTFLCSSVQNYSVKQQGAALCYRNIRSVGVKRCCEIPLGQKLRTVSVRIRTVSNSSVTQGEYLICKSCCAH